MVRSLILVTFLASAAEAPTAADMHAESTRIREECGLKAQRLDEDCCTIAQKWADHMATIKSMRHGGGEQIIARGYTTVVAVFRGWMNSSGHRCWVLSKRPRAGWGAAKSSSGQWYWAGAFRNEKTPTAPPRLNTDFPVLQVWGLIQKSCILRRRENYV